jgi:hypothetical protein
MLVAIAAWRLGTGACHAQFTNPPPQTRLEAFETNTGTIILKAAGLVGTVTATAGTLSVKCETITDTGAGRTEYGLAVGISEQGGQLASTLLIDYDELDSLLNALDALNKVDWSVTTLPSFDAVYTSKGGLRLSAFSSRRNGTIEFAVRTLRASLPPLLLPRDQVAQFREFLAQAKSKLDALRK